MVSVCATCKGLQKHLKSLDGIPQADAASLLWVNTALPALRTSAASCRACALLLQGILLHHDRFASVDETCVTITAETFQPATGRTSQDHLSVDVRWKEQHAHDDCHEDGDDEHTGYPDLKLEFFTDGDGQSSFSAIGQGRHISTLPLHDAGLSSARNMIKSCMSTHSRCRQSKPPTLPKRVLDISSDDFKTVRLYEPEFNPQEQRYEHGEYVALSHVWGTGKGLPKTTKETLQSQKKGIAWSTLPKAIQEAVVLTRALGFRWLWVDALCLIQDDLASKLEESAEMGEVYGNAFLTIAATSALDSSSQPLFASIVPSFKIQAPDNRGSFSKVYVREQPSHYSFKAPFDEGAHMNDWELPFNTSEEANVNTPLLKRAWAFVERLLSVRVLHLTKSEMILECRDGYQCECGRIDDATFDSRTTDSIKQEFARLIEEINRRGSFDGNIINNTTDRVDSITSQFESTTLTDGAQEISHRREEALQLWSYIITEFTARSMTYNADRLLAISSIARLLSPALHSAYVAGQWTFSTMGLLWYPNDSTACRKTKSYPGLNIPSWSWASIEGSPVFFDTASAMDLACRVCFASQQSSSGSWSPLSGETLELSAPMAAEVTLVSSRTDNSTTPSYSLQRNGIRVDFTPDVVSSQGSDALRAGETLVCVLVSMTFRSSIIGLVLQPSLPSSTSSSAADDTVYRRVGRFECYECVPHEGDDDEMSEDAEALFEHWFPEIQDMTQLDNCPLRRLTVV